MFESATDVAQLADDVAGQQHYVILRVAQLSECHDVREEGVGVRDGRRTTGRHELRRWDVGMRRPESGRSGGVVGRKRSAATVATTK